MDRVNSTNLSQEIWRRPAEWINIPGSVYPRQQASRALKNQVT
jgi:hypothetical protein